MKTVEAIWGRERWVVEKPLLVKFIDARDQLSIQLHPDDAMARRRGEPNGKTEMWYVVDALPGATILSGFSRDLSPEEYDRLVAADRIEEAMNRVEVSKGDVFYIPAGRPHSIGAGVRIAEIQQPSDTTYRICDFGRGRELHVDLAREAVDLRAVADPRTHYALEPNRANPLIGSEFFDTYIYKVDRPLSLEPGILVVVDGAAFIGGARLKQGDAVVVDSPAQVIPDKTVIFLMVRDIGII